MASSYYHFIQRGTIDVNFWQGESTPQTWEVLIWLAANCSGSYSLNRDWYKVQFQLEQDAVRFILRWGGQRQ